MNFEWVLAKRFLFSKRDRRFLSAAAWIAVLGLGFSVAALWIAMAVLAGFKTEYRNSILGINAHVIIQKADEIEKVEPLLDDLKGFDRYGPARGSIPFIYREGLAIAGGSVKGIVLKGVDFDSYERLSKMHFERNQEGAENLEHLPEIYLGKTLAQELGLTRGVLRVLFPQGMKPEDMGAKNVRKFFVAGVFTSGLYEYDSSFALLSLPAAQSFFHTEGKVSGVEIWLSDPERADLWAKQLRDVLDYPYVIMTWRELNENIFRALDVEQLIFMIILGVLVAVSASNVIGTLAMLFLERRGDVAILRAMGLPWRRVQKVFLFNGLLIGSAGVAAGLAFGACVLYVLDRWKPLSLAAEVYFVETVPVAWLWFQPLAVSLASLAIVFLACLWTVRLVSRLNTARAILDS